MSKVDASIQRAKHDKGNPYVMIRRATVEDCELSWEARGVLAYILAKPNNWKVRVSDLVNKGPGGRDRMYRILKELQDAEYVEYVEERDKNGHVSGGHYFVSEQPLTGKPDTAEPYTAPPDTAEPYTAKAEAYKEKKETKQPSLPKNQGTNESSSADAGSSVRSPLDEDWKIVMAMMDKAGITHNELIIQRYQAMLDEHGVHAVISGITAAVENGKQNKIRYVETCVENAAQGREPPARGKGDDRPKSYDVDAFLDREAERIDAAQRKRYAMR